MESLYTIKKPKTFPVFSLNIGGLAIFIFDPMLGWRSTTSSPPFSLA